MTMVCQVITAADPTVAVPGRKVNLDVEITFYQFFSALVHCAMHYEPITDSAVDLHPETGDEAHSLLPTTAIERFIHLFQNNVMQSIGSNASLDIVSSSPSRLSATPSQFGASNASLAGQQPGKYIGTSVIVDSPVPVSHKHENK